MKHPAILTLLFLAPIYSYSAPGGTLPVNLWVQPMAGVHAPLGFSTGFGANISHRMVMASVRYITAEELCVFCDDPETSTDLHVLGGIKVVKQAGYFALLTGIARQRWTRMENFTTESDGSFWPETKYDLVPYRGYGIPLMADIGFSFRRIGIGFTVFAIQGSHSSHGVHFTLPFGLIRD